MNDDFSSPSHGMPNPDTQALARFYKESRDYQKSLNDRSESHFTSYLKLVRRFAKPGGRVLEVGCGAGQSSRLLAKAGFDVVGSDLSALFLSGGPRREQTPPLVAANIGRLPFADQSFDAVCALETVEHLTDVGRALDEMARVVRTGGWVLLRSPALASPVWPLIDLPNLLLGRGGRPPHYEGLSQAAGFFGANLARTIRIAARRRPAFERREPDLSPGPVGGDRDAAYWSSPIEIARHFRALGFGVAQQVDGGRALGARWLVSRVAPWLSPTISLAARRDSNLVQRAVHK